MRKLLFVVVTVLLMAMGSAASAHTAKGWWSKPTAANTGPTGTLTPSGGFTVTTNGAVIENRDVSGCITVNANDVTIRNTRVRCGGSWGIYTGRDFYGTIIENSEVEMTSCGDSAVSPRAKKIVFSELHGCADGAKLGSNVGVYSNYIHMVKPCGSSIHLDGLQAMGANNLEVRFNNIDMPASVGGCANGNAAIIFQTEFGPSDNILIDDNWLNGGNYTVFINSKNYGCPTNVSVKDNDMGRDYRYGLYYPACSYTITGNHWEDTGEPANTKGAL